MKREPELPVFAANDEILSQHLAIVGKVGAGKSYAAKGMVERLLIEKRRVCLLDPTGVWWGLRSSADGKKAGFPIVVFGGMHADVHIAEGSGAALAKIIAAKNLPAIIDLSEMLIGGRHRFVTDFAEMLYRENRQPLHLVIDEADEFSPQQPLPETKRMLHHVDRIVRRGRVRGLRVMLITQRPAVLHKNVLAQANTLIAMRLTAPQDRNAIKAWIEGQADAEQGKAVLDSLPRLQRGEGWIWAPELDVLERVAFPKISTFDSSRTPENDETVLEPTTLAAVDLGEITASFAAVEAEAKTVAELTAELAKARRELAGKAPAGVPEAEVQRRIREAVAAVPPTPPAPSLIEGVRGAIGLLQAVAEGFGDEAVVGTGYSRVPLASYDALPRPAKAPPAPPTPKPPPKAAATPQRPAEGITAPQQRLLDALASLEMFGMTGVHKAQLAAHAGVSSTSGGYFNNLGKLRSLGLIDYPTPGEVALTESGRSVASYPEKAPTVADLHAAWLGILPAPQATILQALIDVHPESVPKDVLADTVGVSRTSGGYFNNLGRLRTMGAIEYPAKGFVRTTKHVCP